MNDLKQEHEDRIVAHAHRVELEEAKMRRRWNRIPQMEYRDFIPFDPGKHNEWTKPSDIVIVIDDWRTPLEEEQTRAFQALWER